MGRKDKKGLSEKQEACHKLNFLHQASHAVLAINPDNVAMSRDPSIKRKICKYCHVVLVPGVTATVRLRRKREKHIVVKCLCCKKMKRYLCRPGHVLWSERNLSSVENRQNEKDDPETKKGQKPQKVNTGL
ncbi:PREDICTED: ribonuclease P protein subunit p21-like isoform X2 [Acropora digitifera]|uniref:ribonuclease P protein subunit p21-like isoform X2 n=1 Tax=Acropora digitifera TaxID=70779 RepID=UPI00077ABE26|nr:PREDICTED: ribonuclease P protein subunit p21-like isoform X2 [Acropora digitifera]